ncbi:MAG: penicillin-binding protein [Acidimicrobiia bacterium]|nr:penicillin-binding protein [Acidimicrobiia bacterium]
MVVAGVLSVAVIGLTACSSGTSSQPTASKFLDAWAKGEASAAAALTDNPAAAQTALQHWRSTLDVGNAAFTVKSASGSRATYSADVDLNGLGRWRYSGALTLRKAKSSFVVAWSPSVLYPGLVSGQDLSRTRTLPARAPVLDHNGTPLLTPTPVVTVGVETGRVDPATAVPILQRTTGIDPARVTAAIAAAKPGTFVPVITLRRPAFDPVKATLNAVPGVVFQTTTVDLAPTPTFALPVLGKVGSATAEALKAAGPGFEATDNVGLNGLEGLYQKRLAGTPSGSINVVDANGRALRTLFSVQGTNGQAVRTTLDMATQTAAESALVGTPQPAALVAVKASTGDVLAVANTPADSTYDRALAGRYPPGSSAKVVTSAALLQRGLTVNDVVPCPPRAVVGGKPFTNFEGEAPGAVPFLTDFAKSCNTAFVSVSGRLTAQALADTAHNFGFGAKWTLPLAADSGQFPVPGDAAELAAESIGQGRVLASPMTMALVAAAAGSGIWHPPTLVSDPPQAAAASPVSVDPGIDSALHQLMRVVVTSGTGTAANVAGAGGPVYGKTGTAEFGPGNPPATHAWFIGFRGDIAFAVLVEGGGVGGQVAAPIAAKFLRQLPG